MSEKDFGVVWNPDHGLPYHRHDTMEEARTEATRLASATPGENFYVLVAVGVARKVDVEWQKLVTNIPF